MRSPPRAEDDALGIDAACATLLDPRTSPGDLRQACNAFHARCLAHLPALGGHATSLDSGLALSTADAARCVQDFLRTTGFARAVDAAIASRLMHAPATRVEVLYAGCGPLAPLALLLARRYRHRPVRFTLVDVHPASIAAARRLFAVAGSASLLRAAVCADATRLPPPEGVAFDVLVIETMQRALSREPQLALLAHLLPLCAPDASLVPHRIVVDACLARMAAEFDGAAVRERVVLGTLLELSALSAPALAATRGRDVSSLPEVTLCVPAQAPAGLDLMLRTTIETMPGALLSDYDSGLTYPLFLTQITPAPGDRLGFRYRLGREPGFEVRRVPSRQAPAPAARAGIRITASARRR